MNEKAMDNRERVRRRMLCVLNAADVYALLDDRPPGLRRTFDLPADAVVVGVNADPYRLGFVVTVMSQEFDPVPEGALPPERTPRYEVVKKEESDAGEVEAVPGRENAGVGSARAEGPSEHEVRAEGEGR